MPSERPAFETEVRELVSRVLDGVLAAPTGRGAGPVGAGRNP